jgi:hypothetical protein
MTDTAKYIRLRMAIFTVAAFAGIPAMQVWRAVHRD